MNAKLRVTTRGNSQAAPLPCTHRNPAACHIADPPKALKAPGAVVVHPEHAPAQALAMVGARRLPEMKFHFVDLLEFPPLFQQS